MADFWFPTAVISHFYSAVYLSGILRPTNESSSDRPTHLEGLLNHVLIGVNLSRTLRDGCYHVFIWVTASGAKTYLKLLNSNPSVSSCVPMHFVGSDVKAHKTQSRVFRQNSVDVVKL